MSDRSALQVLEERVRQDLERTNHPAKPWMTPTQGPGGARQYDVIIVGAGQGGLAIAFALLREQVDNILVIDQAAAGEEGCWFQYARMPTLRSPKEFNGPDLGMPSLTYRSWHEAVYSVAHWHSLERIATDDWHAYLAWFRRILKIPVRNDTRLVSIADAGAGADALVLDVQTAGQHATLWCRKLVLATGQTGTGQWAVPEPFRSLPADRCAVAADTINFEALRNKRIAVVGQGASAADNAACALEHGAKQVHMLVRRPQLQRVQPFLWLTFAGFLRHVGDLPDEWRWRFMHRILSLRESIPQATWDRMNCHQAFRLMLNAPVRDVTVAADGLQLNTPAGAVHADFIILGTGVEIDFSMRPELSGLADEIATWSDCYQPPADEHSVRLGRFPYLSADGTFTERRPGRAPALQNIYDFTIGSTMSFGPSGCSINAMTIAVPRLVAGITRRLFRADIAAHWASLKRYDTPIFDPNNSDEVTP